MQRDGRGSQECRWPGVCTRRTQLCSTGSAECAAAPMRCYVCIDGACTLLQAAVLCKRRRAHAAGWLRPSAVQLTNRRSLAGPGKLQRQC